MTIAANLSVILRGLKFVATALLFDSAAQDLVLSFSDGDLHKMTQWSFRVTSGFSVTPSIIVTCRAIDGSLVKLTIMDPSKKLEATLSTLQESKRTLTKLIDEYANKIDLKNISFEHPNVEDALNAEAQHLAETQQAIDLPSQSRTDDTNTKTNTQPGLSNLLEASESMQNTAGGSHTSYGSHASSRSQSVVSGSSDAGPWVSVTMEVDRENRAGAQVMFGDQVHVRWLEQNGASYEFEGLSYIGDISEPRCEGNKLVWTKSNRDPAFSTKRISDYELTFETEDVAERWYLFVLQKVFE